jgi:serine/threonine-protein kinase
MSDTVTLTFGDGAGDSANRVDLEVPRELGHVRLVEEVGRGAMGVVWRGDDTFLNRKVAVKLMRHLKLDGDSARQQFIEGARAAAAVQHPNVVSVYHADEIEGIVYIAMEFVGGYTLLDLLRRHDVVPANMAAFIVSKSLDALCAIHQAQVIHRDLKPSNVMFDTDGALKVSDFGLSFQRRDTFNEDTSMGGTPAYMAPEMFSGEASFQSDVYALGIIYYQLVCGQRPFVADSIDEYHQAHSEAPLPTAALVEAGAEAAVVDMIERATHKRKIFRYKTAEHMAQALNAIYPRVSHDVQLQRALTDLLQAAESPADGRQTDNDDSGAQAGTYFDLLSNRAEAKRRRKDG